MRKLLPLVLFVLCLLVPGVSDAQVVVVNPASHCAAAGGSHPGPTLALGAGTYMVEWTSGAYSPWSSDNQNATPWRATVRAFIAATAEDVALGPGGAYLTSAAAQAAANGTVWPLTLSVASNVTFHIHDTPCGDNRGSITLTFQAPTGTEGTSWGSVKTLFR